jgi:hypothetical protein
MHLKKIRFNVLQESYKNSKAVPLHAMEALGGRGV